MENIKHTFRIAERKQNEFWRGAITGVMYAFGSTSEEEFRWWWLLDDGGRIGFECTLECSSDLFTKIVEYINGVIPGDVFEYVGE